MSSKKIRISGTVGLILGFVCAIAVPFLIILSGQWPSMAHLFWWPVCGIGFKIATTKIANVIDDEKNGSSYYQRQQEQFNKMKQKEFEKTMSKYK